MTGKSLAAQREAEALRVLATEPDRYWRRKEVMEKMVATLRPKTGPGMRAILERLVSAGRVNSADVKSNRARQRDPNRRPHQVYKAVVRRPPPSRLFDEDVAGIYAPVLTYIGVMRPAAPDARAAALAFTTQLPDAHTACVEADLSMPQLAERLGDLDPLTDPRTCAGLVGLLRGIVENWSDPRATRAFLDAAVQDPDAGFVVRFAKVPNLTFVPSGVGAHCSYAQALQVLLQFETLAPTGAGRTAIDALRDALGPDASIDQVVIDAGTGHRPEARLATALSWTLTATVGEQPSEVTHADRLLAELTAGSRALPFLAAVDWSGWAPDTQAPVLPFRGASRTAIDALYHCLPEADENANISAMLKSQLRTCVELRLFGTEGIQTIRKADLSRALGRQFERFRAACGVPLTALDVEGQDRRIAHALIRPHQVEG